MDRPINSLYKTWLMQLGLAAFYVLVGKLTLDCFSINGAVSVFWPASGLALAALLIGGKRYVCGVFLGAVVQNAMTGITWYEATIIASGNAIEALLGAWLLTREGGFDPGFRFLRDYLRLVLMAGLVACLVPAITGSTVLFYSGYLGSGEYLLNLAQWWMGDVLGVVLITPLVLICQKPRNWFNKRLGLELGLVLGLTFLAGQIVFLGRFDSLFGSVPMGYVMFPIVLWAALRFGLLGVLPVQVLVAVQGLMGAHQGVGFFADDIAQTQLANYWFFMMFLSIAGAALAAYNSQARFAESALLATRNQLEATLQAVPDLMFELGPDGRYHEVYASSPEFLAAPASELIGKTIFDVLPAKPAETVMFALREAQTAGWSHGKQFQLALAQGDLWFELSVARKPADPGRENHFIVLSRNITDRKVTEQALQQSEAHLRSMMDNSPYMTWLKDAEGRYLMANKVFARFLRLEDERQLIGKTDLELQAKDFAEKYRADDAEVLSSREQKHVEELAHDGNKAFWVETFKTPVIGADGKVLGTAGFAKDISARKLAEEELRIAAAAFQSQEAMVITDADGTILRINRAFAESTGYAADEVVGQNPRLFKSGRHGEPFYKAMWERILQTGSWQGEVWDRRKNGEIYPKWLTISAVKDQAGRVTHYIGTHLDITERKKTEERIAALAFYDQLTGLPNRTLLFDRIRQAQISSVRHKLHGALMLLDMDNFKALNDTLGHDVGDRFLVEVGQRLQACVREGDTVARLGGDEFVVLLEELSEDSLAAMQAESVAVKILGKIGQPYQLDATVEGKLRKHGYHGCASIGIALFCGNTLSTDELLKRADLAMYQAKAAGRNTLRFFDPEMQAVVTTRSELEADLRVALQRNQLFLEYQPQVEDSIGVIGAEALLRWAHPERGTISPQQFIPIAEETGLILPLGQWVLETACAQLASWAMRPETSGLVLAINVSARQFRARDFVDQVLAAVERTSANPCKLKLELTESMLESDTQDIIAKMVALKARGIDFSLDDFGTGYSSLSYLKRLPLSQLKIDRSFVNDILTDPNDATIARTIVALAESLGLAVIAEGVETEMQRDSLAALGCHVYQGYLYSRPLALEDFFRFLNKGNHPRCERSLALDDSPS